MSSWRSFLESSGYQVYDEVPELNSSFPFVSWHSLHLKGSILLKYCVLAYKSSKRLFQNPGRRPGDRNVFMSVSKDVLGVCHVLFISTQGDSGTPVVKGITGKNMSTRT